MENIKISRLHVFGFENAIIGMRFPKDSEFKYDSHFEDNKFIFGNNDLELALRLIKAGKSHRKFLRMIHLQCAINMPIGWWIQMDTYKISTTANSRSRMHKFGNRLLSKNDFFVINWDNNYDVMLENINFYLLEYKKYYGHDKNQAEFFWRKALDMLPMSYCQERMWDSNYEVLINILADRYCDKLKYEWKYFCDYMIDNCYKFKEFFDVVSYKV
jgi:hypothetical protein